MHNTNILKNIVRNLKVILIASRDSRNRYNFLLEPLKLMDNVTVKLIKNEKNIFQFTRQSLKQINEFKDYDCVIAIGANYTSLLWALLTIFVIKAKFIVRLGGNPFAILKNDLYDVVSSLNTKRLLYIITNTLFTPIILLLSDHVIVVSEYLQKTFEKYYFRKTKFAVIPQFVKCNVLNLNRKTKENNINLLTVTNLQYKKKFYPIKKVISYLAMANNRLEQKINYRILGGGVYKNELIAYLDKLDLRSTSLNVEVLGYVDDPVDFYKSSDVFLYASEIDILPNVLLEAQSFGLPLLVNKYQPFYDMFKCKENVLFFDIDDREEFLGHCHRLFSNKELRSSIGQENFKYVCENYTIESVAKQLFYLLKKIC